MFHSLMRFIRWCGDIDLTKNEREYYQQLSSRERLDEIQFYERHYIGSDVPEDVVRIARAEMISIYGIGLESLRPADNLAVSFDCVDFTDVLFRMERRFKIKIPRDACWSEIDGTFDSLVRYISRR